MENRIYKTELIDWQKVKDLQPEIFYHNNIEFYYTKYSNIAVSKCGKIYSLRYKKINANQLDKDGYRRTVVVYSINGIKIKKTKKVHRIVAERFLNNYLENLVVNHKDFNKCNNSIENLEMCSVLENNTHLFRNKKNKTSSYVGVYFDNKEKKYISTISINSKTIRLGSFVNESEALNRRLEYFKNNNIQNKYALQ